MNFMDTMNPDNRRQIGRADQCVVCARKVRRYRYGLKIDARDNMIRVSDTVSPGELFVIGSECANKVPQGFLHQHPNAGLTCPMTG